VNFILVLTIQSYLFLSLNFFLNSYLPWNYFNVSIFRWSLCHFYEIIRLQLFLRHLPNCPCSNFSRYVDLFQEISPRIAKQLRFWVKLHHIRRKCKNDNPGFSTMEYLQWKTQMLFLSCTYMYLFGYDFNNMK
jgi:hypothetical protein